MSQVNQMYGCDPDAFIASVKDSLGYKFSGALMCAASLMSDAQEEIAAGMDERARQSLNRSKLILGEVMDGNLIGSIPRSAA
jgi:hypothetical protein